MTQDPIVDEIHKIREKMLSECDGDIDKLMDQLKEREREEENSVISLDEFQNQPSLAH